MTTVHTSTLVAPSSMSSVATFQVLMPPIPLTGTSAFAGVLHLQISLAIKPLGEYKLLLP